jgi:hypothetical protein
MIGVLRITGHSIRVTDLFGDVHIVFLSQQGFLLGEPRIVQRRPIGGLAMAIF